MFNEVMKAPFKDLEETLYEFLFYDLNKEVDISELVIISPETY